MKRAMAPARAKTVHRGALAYSRQGGAQRQRLPRDTSRGRGAYNAADNAASTLATHRAETGSHRSGNSLRVKPGHDSIAIFAVDAQAGTLEPVGWNQCRARSRASSERTRTGATS